jgi:OOP family OmpA-OmpF porin
MPLKRQAGSVFEPLPIFANQVICQRQSQREEGTMRREACFTIVGAALVAVLSTSVSAEQGYTGAGPYLGIGPAGGFSTFQDDLKGFGNSLGFNARGGYRFNDYLAAEALYEYMDDFGTTVSAGNRVGGHVDIQTNHFSLLGKVILPTGTLFEPYAVGGIGFLNANGNGKVNTPGAQLKGTDSDTEFSGRVGGGFDAWITENIAAYVDAAFVMPTGGLSNLRSVSLGAGVKYSFAPPRAAPPAPVPPAPAARPAPPVRRKIVLRGVHFDFDKSTIRADARPVLDEAIATLKQEGGIAVIAEGYTDSVGTDAYNMKLSQRRAKAVRDYLVTGGISPRRITAEGFGETHPVASNDTADGRAQNRRVELRVRGD